jgi:hypothetical protein
MPPVSVTLANLALPTVSVVRCLLVSLVIGAPLPPGEGAVVANLVANAFRPHQTHRDSLRAKSQVRSCHLGLQLTRTKIDSLGLLHTEEVTRQSALSSVGYVRDDGRARRLVKLLVRRSGRVQ